MARKPNPENAPKVIERPAEYSNEVTKMFFETAFDIKEQEAKLAKAKIANRTMLRGLLDTGALNKSETETLALLYTPRADSERAAQGESVAEVIEMPVTETPAPRRSRRNRQTAQAS